MNINSITKTDLKSAIDLLAKVESSTDAKISALAQNKLLTGDIQQDLTKLTELTLEKGLYIDLFPKLLKISLQFPAYEKQVAAQIAEHL